MHRTDTRTALRAICDKPRSPTAASATHGRTRCVIWVMCAAAWDADNIRLRSFWTRSKRSLGFLSIDQQIWVDHRSAVIDLSAIIRPFNCTTRDNWRLLAIFQAFCAFKNSRPSLQTRHFIDWEISVNADYWFFYPFFKLLCNQLLNGWFAMLSLNIIWVNSSQYPPRLLRSHWTSACHSVR